MPVPPINDAGTSPGDHPASSKPPIQRRVSIDVFRGMVMFLMLASMMQLFKLASVFPGYRVFEWLRFHTEHVAWEGCSLHDIIQPAFTFIVGVSMPFSIASRLGRGESKRRLLLHAAWRSVILIALGIILRSLNHNSTNFIFTDTLAQIGLGYFFVFLIALCPPVVHYVSAALILVLFWLGFALSSAPPADFDYASVGVNDQWQHHNEGFASRWNKNSNLSWKVDQWFLNLFPRETPFVFNSGGYATLSFVPTAVTILFGLIAGVWIRDLNRKQLYSRLLAFTVMSVLAGWLLDAFGICPLVKRLWTPSFTLYSGGLCMAWMTALIWICDDKQRTSWGFPFIVIGANSILIYVMSWTIAKPVQDMLLRHFGRSIFAIAGDELVPLFSGAATLAILFYVLLFLYRRRVFIKI